MTFKNDVRGSAKTPQSKVYQNWAAMRIRCTSAVFRKRYPTYVGVTASPEFELFSTWSIWFAANYIEGYSTDKDILRPGNKFYSAETCVFVPPELNSLLTQEKANRGDYPPGVAFYKRTQKFIANIRLDGEKRHLGYFSTPEAAAAVYVDAKVEAIGQWMTDDRVRCHPRSTAIIRGLMLHQIKLIDSLLPERKPHV